jgi:NRPS condensation-like uncharacterized protein
MTTPAIPARFPATPNDVATAVARQLGQHMEIGCHLTFTEHLDENVLRKAVRHTLDAEPILGCAYVPDAFKAWWARLGDVDSALPFSVAETTDANLDAKRFQTRAIDDAGPQVAVRLLRAIDHDEVSLRLSHVAADGQSAKQYAYLLGDTYARLLADTAYAPEPNLTPRPSSADVWKGLSPKQRQAAKRSPKMTMPNWLVPRLAETGQGRTFAELVVDAERFDALRAFGTQHGATLNDLLLTAFFRALAGVYPPPSGKPMSLPFSAEHRRYLPSQEGLPISNLAITLWLGFAWVAGESFEATLARACEQTRAWRSALWGVKGAAQATRLMALGPAIAGGIMKATARLGSGRDSSLARTSPVFTNIGVLDESRLRFGSAVPISARLSGPAAFGASFVPTISTYRDSVTVSMGYCAEDMDVAVIDAVLSGMDQELGRLATA